MLGFEIPLYGVGRGERVLDGDLSWLDFPQKHLLRQEFVYK